MLLKLIFKVKSAFPSCLISKNIKWRCYTDNINNATHLFSSTAIHMIFFQ